MSSETPTYRPLRRALLLVLAALGLLPSFAEARTIDFSWRDRALLGPGKKHSSRLWVPNSARRGTSYTLVILLHGLNKKGRLQPLMSESGVDVPAIATRLIRSGVARQRFVIAAPTQLVDAKRSSSLWRRIDVPSFVAAVRRRMPRGMRLRDRVVLMGHSGAGCSSRGGLWWAAKQLGPKLRAVATMDTCMDRSFGEHLHKALWPRKRSGGAWLLNFWQEGWKRHPQDFEEAMGFELLAERGPRQMRDVKRNARRWLSARIEMQGGHAHKRIVENIFEEALRRLFPTKRTLNELNRELKMLERARARRRAEARARARRRRRKKK